MANNFLEELQNKKQEVRSLVEKANAFGWWKDENEKAKKEGKPSMAETILQKLDKEILTIGVIGQMKCGKSTFLNSFVFGKEILPAATTPMTASLTVIKYGAEEKLIAEFYTKDEWEEQKQTAQLNPEEYNDVIKSKIKAAQELVQQSSSLGSQINSLLGKTQTDTLSNLEQYVGATGKYVAITKSVVLEYPAEYLKGVEIVDTPGFNDPIVSREERTKEFLQRADAVLMVLYANQPFSKSDCSILFDNVCKCGTGKVLVAINKYDGPLLNGESEKSMSQYVKEQLEIQIEQSNNSTVKQTFGSEIDPICFSALMEILSQLPMSVITADETKKFHYERYLREFGLDSQKALHEMSRVDVLVSRIKAMIATEKDQILFKKPVTQIVAKGESLLDKVKNDLSLAEEAKRLCGMSDEDLEERKDIVDKIIRKVERKSDRLGEDIEDSIEQICSKGEMELDDVVNSCVDKMYRAISDWGTFGKKSELEFKLQRLQDQLVNRDLKYKVKDIQNDSINKLKRVVSDYSLEIEELICDKLPDDFDKEDLARGLKKSLAISGNDQSVGSEVSLVKEELISRAAVNVIAAVAFGGIGLGGKLIWDALNHSDKQNEYRNKVKELQNSLNTTELCNSIRMQRDGIVESAKNVVLKECLQPLREQIQKIIDDKEGRERQRKEADEKVAKFTMEKTELEKQLKEIKSFAIVESYYTIEKIA